MSDTIEAPIVDVATPVEITPSPIEAFIPKAESAAGPTAPSEVPTPPVGSSLIDMFDPTTTSQVEAPAAPTPPANTEVDKVSALSKAYGMDLSRFPTEAAAVSAISFLADQWSNLGQDQYGFAPPAPAPTTSPVQATQFEFPKLDPTLVDPSLIAAFNAVKDRTEKLQTELTTLRAAEQTSTAAQFESSKQQLLSRANVSLDGMNSPKYGTAASRTEAQRIAFENVSNEAGKIIMGMARANMTPPPIEQIMAMAVTRDKSWGPPAAPAQNASKPTAPFALPPNNPANAGISAGTRLPRVSKANDPFGMFENPTTKAIYQEGLRR